MKVRIITRPELAAGFALAGVEVTRARDAVAAAEAIARETGDARVGIVLVDQSLYEGIPHDLRTRWDRHAAALIVPIPSPSWERPGAAEAYILEILRQAIGYRVRPR